MKSRNDEFFTPRYAIVPILKYVRKGTTIWCPFDDEHSHFVEMFEEYGCRVIKTHINSGQDFFKTTPPKCDYILSNPPYSLKTDVIERLFKIGIPFAMLVSSAGLFESKKRFKILNNNRFEIMYLSRRVWYFLDFNKEEILNNPPFLSVYLCHKILPKQIVFEDVYKYNEKIKKISFKQKCSLFFSQKSFLFR